MLSRLRRLQRRRTCKTTRCVLCLVKLALSAQRCVACVNKSPLKGESIISVCTSSHAVRMTLYNKAVRWKDLMTSVISLRHIQECNGRATLQVQGRALLPGSALFEAALAAGHAARANDGSLPEVLGLAVTSATIAAPLVLPQHSQPQPRLTCLLMLR